ncbi:polysaccharide biosynthesis protein [Mediterranea sp. An20]|uniref:polysaccharide biosynthesis protein n=1 Tax=Mediterranea sp. An20 TaxID=1965586 RepID=UPI000B38DCBF|nr:polysaccharide biosynthesis protein [Mediterranea sp. An20]OUP07242.1 polysaccharide biosynthesis protein [Mediterranea sp. An20]
MTSVNKTIAKNTIFLYFRMMFTMLVTLYTSRVILDVLGITDYGLYQTVGGVVGMLSFINGALSGGASRFLTFELGAGNKDRLKKTFSTTLVIHLGLAAFLFLVSETIGLWFLYDKLVIPDDRLLAVVLVYHLSIATAVVNLLTVPYNASIISHECMAAYAYLSIFECSAKLLIVYLLGVGGFDKLITYAFLILLLQVGIWFYYMRYSTSRFEETKFSFFFDKSIFKRILGFSSWSLFAQGSIALNSQGILLLLNMFFEPAVVAARSISIQVNMAANQFVSNFRMAVNPQIVKRYAANDKEGSKHLLLVSTKYSYYLMWVICFPLCLLARPILELWLVEVPDYTVIFLQLILIQSLFQVFDTSFYTALYAKGQLRENALISPLIGFIAFPIIYLLFKMGYPPVALSWAMLVVYALLGLVVKPLLLIRIVNYTWADIWQVFRPCLIVTIVSLPIPLLVNYFWISLDNLWQDFLLLLISIVCVGLSVWFCGLKRTMRKLLIDKLKVLVKIKKE